MNEALVERVAEAIHAAAQNRRMAGHPWNWTSDEERGDCLAYARAAIAVIEAERTAEVAALRAAIEDEGPVPMHHRVTMRTHREQWPTLWAAIDALLEHK